MYVESWDCWEVVAHYTPQAAYSRSYYVVGHVPTLRCEQSVVVVVRLHDSCLQ